MLWTRVWAAASWVWRQWPIILIGWFFCAVWVVVAIKHEKHKALLSVYGNGLIATVIVAPFAFISPDGSPGVGVGISDVRSSSLWARFWSALLPLRANFLLVLLIAILSALERNLTNASLYWIGGSLKTALHGFNVVLVFFCGAVVAGVDERARSCIFGRCCTRLTDRRVQTRQPSRRCRLSNLAMVPVLLLVGGGGLVTAISGKQSDFHGNIAGVLLQLSSGVAYGLKYIFMKVLFLGLWSSNGTNSNRESVDDHLSLRDLQNSDTMLIDGVTPTNSSDVQRRGSATIPSKTQIALVTQPITGLVGLIFQQIFENGDWTPPAFDVVFFFALGVTGILIFELQLVQLTSPLTVAVLSALHNVVIVLYFVLKDGEKMVPEQIYGFAVSTVGVIGYAAVKHVQRLEDEKDAVSYAHGHRHSRGAADVNTNSVSMSQGSLVSPTVVVEERLGQ